MSDVQAEKVVIGYVYLQAEQYVELFEYYKVVIVNLSDSYYQLKVNEWVEYTGEPSLRARGFEFSFEPMTESYISRFMPSMQLWRVALDDIQQINYRTGTAVKGLAKRIMLLQPICLQNPPKHNLINSETDYNTGSNNHGNANSGAYNWGNSNTAHNNTGNGNSGYYNSGNYNSGNNNIGSGNTGFYNITDNSTGYFNTCQSNVFCFNVNTGMTALEFNQTYYAYLYPLYTQLKRKDEEISSESIVAEFKHIPGISIEVVTEWRKKYQEHEAQQIKKLIERASQPIETQC